MRKRAEEAAAQDPRPACPHAHCVHVVCEAVRLAGLVLGIVEIAYRIAGYQVSVGTVVLIALLLISGSQFTLFAMWFDMETNKDLR